MCICCHVAGGGFVVNCYTNYNTNILKTKWNRSNSLNINETADACGSELIMSTYSTECVSRTCIVLDHYSEC